VIAARVEQRRRRSASQDHAGPLGLGVAREETRSSSRQRVASGSLRRKPTSMAAAMKRQLLSIVVPSSMAAQEERPHRSRRRSSRQNTEEFGGGSPRSISLVGSPSSGSTYREGGGSLLRSDALEELEAEGSPGVPTRLRGRTSSEPPVYFRRARSLERRFKRVDVAGGLEVSSPEAPEEASRTLAGRTASEPPQFFSKPRGRSHYRPRTNTGHDGLVQTTLRAKPSRRVTSKDRQDFDTIPTTPRAFAARRPSGGHKVLAPRPSTANSRSMQLTTGEPQPQSRSQSPRERGHRSFDPSSPWKKLGSSGTSSPDVPRSSLDGSLGSRLPLPAGSPVLTRHRKPASPRQGQSAMTFRGFKLMNRPDILLGQLRVERKLGCGQFGRVLHVAWRSVEDKEAGRDTEEVFALKIIDRKRFKHRKHEEMVLAEKRTMEQLNDPFHIRLVNTYKTPTRLFLLTELAPGGDLGHLVKTEGISDANRCRFYIANTVLALRHLHDHDVIHRDIKPSNLLVSANGFLKLCDYGFSKFLPRGERTQTFVGTYAYLSPELCRAEEYDHAVDLWSLGVVMFEMIYGVTPFDTEIKDRSYSLRVMHAIQTKEVVFPERKVGTGRRPPCLPIWSHASS